MINSINTPIPNPTVLPSAYHGYDETITRPPLLKLPRDVLTLIVKELVKQKASLIPLHFVCKRIANLPEVQAEKPTKAVEVRYRIENAAENALAQGSIPLVAWFHNRLRYRLTIESSAAAARNDKPTMLQWLRVKKCPWDSRTAIEAARRGHLEVLQWARANGCPWDEGTCASAAKKGHLEILKWARANGCPWDDRTWNNAHENVRKWLRENGCPGANEPASACLD